MSWCFWAKSTNEIEDTDAVDEENDDGGHSVICQGVQISMGNLSDDGANDGDGRTI